jgi:hypothetical protein
MPLPPNTPARLTVDIDQRPRLRLSVLSDTLEVAAPSLRRV